MEKPLLCSTNQSSSLTPANGLAGGEVPFTDSGERGVSRHPAPPEVVVLALRLPNRKTHPNGRPHWRARAAAVKIDRQYAGLVTRAEMGGRHYEWPKATIKAVWTFKTAAKRDKDGLLSWCKAYFDGFADAGLVVNDSEFTHLPHTVTKGPNEGVTFYITKGEPTT